MDLATFATEYFVPTATDAPGVTELRRFAGPFIKATGFDEAIETAARLSIHPIVGGPGVPLTVANGPTSTPVAYYQWSPPDSDPPRLHPDDVEAIARRVAELLTPPRPVRPSDPVEDDAP